MVWKALEDKEEARCLELPRVDGIWLVYLRLLRRLLLRPLRPDGALPLAAAAARFCA